MSSNAIGRLWDSASAAQTPGYGRIVDGLRDFDRLGAALRARQDGVSRSALAAASAYPQPAFGRAPAGGAALAAAVATYAQSDAGRERLERLAGAAGSFLSRLFSGGPEQLALPLE